MVDNTHALHGQGWQTQLPLKTRMTNPQQVFFFKGHKAELFPEASASRFVNRQSGGKGKPWDLLTLSQTDVTTEMLWGFVACVQHATYTTRVSARPDPTAQTALRWLHLPWVTQSCVSLGKRGGKRTKNKAEDTIILQHSQAREGCVGKMGIHGVWGSVMETEHPQQPGGPGPQARSLDTLAL